MADEWKKIGIYDERIEWAEVYFDNMLPPLFSVKETNTGRRLLTSM